MHASDFLFGRLSSSLSCRRDVRTADFSRLIPSIIQHLCDQPKKDGVSMDFLPPEMLKKHKLLPWLEALRIMHTNLGQDVPVEARQAARRRLVFNESLLLSLMLLHHRAHLQLANFPCRHHVLCNNWVCPASTT
jgi:RecG-like helicase